MATDDWQAIKVKPYDPFPKAVQTPTVGAFDEPTVAVFLNKEWVSYIIGAMQRLHYSDVWRGNADEVQFALDQIDLLMCALAGACQDMNFNVTCDTGDDCGVTYDAETRTFHFVLPRGLPGADGEDGADSTVAGPPGADGEDGADSTVAGPPGADGADCDCPPAQDQVPPPDGEPGETLRCHVAANLAPILINRYYIPALDAAAAGVTDTDTAIQVLTNFSPVLFFPLFLLGPARDYFADVMLKSISALKTTALTTQFNDDLMCVILDCIGDDAYIDQTQIDCIGDTFAAFDANDAYEDFGAWISNVMSVQEMRYLVLLAAAGDVTDDCDCDDEHCFTIDFRLGNGAAQGWVNDAGTYVAGVGINGAYGGSTSLSDVTGHWSFGSDVFVTEIRFIYNKAGGAGANNVNKLNALIAPLTNYATTFYSQDNSNPLSSGDQMKTMAVNHSIRGIGIDVNTGTYGSSPARIVKIEVHYTGDIHAGWTDNC